MKKILVIGAGYLQSFLIKKSVEMGFYTITLDKNPDSIGFKYAHDYSVIDIMDKEACLNFAKNNNIDGVITAATDYGVITTAYIAKQLGLNGLNLSTAEIIKDKYKVREILQNMASSRKIFFTKANSIKDIDVNIINRELPLILKPVDGSGSKGVIKVNDIEDLENSFLKSIKYSMSQEVLIESYITGVEYGVEVFVLNNKIQMIEVLGKEMTCYPFFSELGHFSPINEEVEKLIKFHITNIISELKVNFGSLNFDVIVDDKNNVNVIDIGARMGGNLIYSHIIPNRTGIPYMENALHSVVNNFHLVKGSSGRKKFVSSQILAFRKGYLKQNIDMEEICKKYDVEIYSRLTPDMRIVEYKDNLDGYGYIIGLSEINLIEARKKTYNAFDEINYYIESE